MAETTNYKLYLTDNNTEKFLEWRNKINGVDDSNMIKIDTLLKERAIHSISVSTSLLADNWIGTEAPYLQIINIDGLSATANGSISLSQNATAEEREVAREAMLSVTDQGENTLTIVADGDLPTIDISVCVIIVD